MAWRYMAQRATTGEWLDRQLAFVRRDTASTSLNAAGRFRGTVVRNLGLKRAADGLRVLERDATILWALNGSKHYAYLLDRSEWADGEWQIEGTSIGGYPAGMIYDAEFRGVRVDPADVIRSLWAHLQSYPDGSFGVKVVGSTPLRIGTDSDIKAAAAQRALDTAQADVDVKTKERDRLRKLVKDTRDKVLADKNRVKSAASKNLSGKKRALTVQKAELTAAKKAKDPARIARAQQLVATATRDVNTAQAALDQANAELGQTKVVVKQREGYVDAQQKIVDAAEKVRDTRRDAKQAADQQASEDGGAYKVLWPDNPDVGAEIAKLVEATPLDWTEESHVTDDVASHTITIHYPRAGRLRTDLRFAEGENVVSHDPIVDASEGAANAWVGIGAGEGTGSVHRSVSVRDGHVRRTGVYSDKSVQTNTLMDRRLANRLRASRTTLTVPRVRVRDHPNARIASWDIGDDIDVTVVDQFLGTVTVRSRIISWSPITDDTAELTLQRSDSFLYGG